jgi:hypothetical protein
MNRILTLLAVVFVPSLGAAEEIRLVLWNCEAMFNVATVTARAADLQDFGQHFADADVVVLDEVTSLAVVNAVRDQMGFLGFHTACSDFNQNDMTRSARWKSASSAGFHWRTCGNST